MEMEKNAAPDHEKLADALRLFAVCSPIFAALGDATRQSLLVELARSGAGGRDVASLTATTELSRPAVSHHLKVLKDAGLVLPFKRGTQVFYRLCLEDKIGSMKSLVLLIEELVREAAPLCGEGSPL